MVYLLLGTTISTLLPNLLGNDSNLINNLHYVKNKLHSEGSSAYSFTQCDRKSPFRKVPVVGQISDKVMQKILEKEMVGAGEFINQLVDRLFADGIVENPFEAFLSDLYQRVAFRYTKGIIDKRNYIEAKISNTDWSDAIRLQSVIYGSFLVTWK